MYDPMTVAFEIKSPFKNKNGERNNLITIWHVDPCKDGTDDSCGWFLRPRHLDKNVLDKIKSEFDFNFKHNYWFDKEGKQIFSTIGTLIQMYSTATWICFNRNRRKQKRFMKNHLLDIITFAENPVDCGGDSITNKWKTESHEERFNGMAGMIYSDICRKQRKWYQHPKWHIHHWSIQFHLLQKLKRRWWDNCCICGKRGFKRGAIGDWNGTKMWHEECDNSAKPVPENNSSLKCTLEKSTLALKEFGRTLNNLNYYNNINKRFEKNCDC